MDHKQVLNFILTYTPSADIPGGSERRLGMSGEPEEFWIHTSIDKIRIRAKLVKIDLENKEEPFQFEILSADLNP